MQPRAGADHSVVIVGGGQSGVDIATHERVFNALVVPQDAAPCERAVVGRVRDMARSGRQPPTRFDRTSVASTL